MKKKELDALVRKLLQRKYSVGICRYCRNKKQVFANDNKILTCDDCHRLKQRFATEEPKPRKKRIFTNKFTVSRSEVI